MPRPRRRYAHLLLALALLLTLVALPTPTPAAAATTYTVTTGDDSGPGSLRQAIFDANATPATGDTITFAPGITTVTLTSQSLIISTNLTIDGGSGVTVTRSAASDTPDFHPFTISSGTATLTHLTITGGRAATGAPYPEGGSGGGVYVHGRSTQVTLANTTISGNSANEGGGVYVFNSTVYLTNTTISNNTAANNGGGVFSHFFSMVTLTNSTLSGNEVTYNSGGGAFFRGGTATLTNTTLSGNRAGNGGGIYADGDGPGQTVALTNSTLSGNFAIAYGGGLLVYGGSNVTLTNSTLSGNTANIGGGGGVYVNGASTATLTNSTLSGNIGNIAYGSGGVSVASNSSAILAGTIIAGNASAPGQTTCSADSGGVITDNGYNLETADTCGFRTATTAPSGTSQVNTAPQLGPLADNGGPTRTHLPAATSPARDKIPANTCATLLASPGPGAVDQRGVPRSQDTSCDIGAVEATTATLTATSASGPYAGTATLTATLAATSGALAGQPISFALNGTPVGTATTNSSGVATLSNASLAGLAAGTHPTGVSATAAHWGAGGTDLTTTAQLTVAQAAQTIAFPAPDPATRALGDPPLALVASATSGLPVTFAASPSTVCTASGSTLTLRGVGDCTIVATQPGYPNWLPAPAVTQRLTVVACAVFADVPPSDPAYLAVTALTCRGVIKGYNTTPPRFGPTDNVQRSQVAAMLVRALNWQGRTTSPRQFNDLGQLDPELQQSVRLLANACDVYGNCVARGYTATTFAPLDNVSRAQVVAFVTRAFLLDGRWQPQAAPAPYTGVPPVFASEFATYHHYVSAIPNAPTTTGGWNTPASRAWIAQVLWAALQSAP